MVGPKVVNLLLEHAGPEVFADKLHDVQLVFEPCCVLCKSVEKEKQIKWVPEARHYSYHVFSYMSPHGGEILYAV